MEGRTQDRSTRETKVVLVVSERTNTVTGIVLFNEIEKRDQQAVLAEYPESKFFIGLLQGSYRNLEGMGIAPLPNTTVNMYTSKEYFPGDQFFPGEQFVPGDPFKLGNIRARVVSSKDDRLTLKIRNR